MGKKAHIKKARTCLVCKHAFEAMTQVELRDHAERCAILARKRAK